MKYVRVLAFVGLSLIVPACALDGPMGVSQDPKTGQVTITDANGGVVGKIGGLVKGAGDATSGTPIGLILWGVGSVLSLGAHVYQYARTGQWQNAAVATAQGVQDAVSKLDSAHGQAPVAGSVIADTIKAAIDLAHDSHDVPQAIQNALTPTT